MSTGEQPVGMDADALTVTSYNFGNSAHVIKEQAGKVAENMIDKSHVGAAYAAEGGKLENGLRDVEAWLNEWSEATRLTGEAIGRDVAAVSFVDDENSKKTQQAAS